MSRRTPITERWATDVWPDPRQKQKARADLDGLLAFDKNQKRGPDGRWIPEGGDWLDLSQIGHNDMPGARQVAKFMNEELPPNVREAFKKRGVRVEARSGSLNEMPGIKGTGMSVDGIYYWDDRWGKETYRKAYVDTDVPNPSHPPGFVVAHELGHAFDRLGPDAPISETTEWTDLVADAYDGDYFSSPTHDPEFFAHVFAAANGHSEGAPPSLEWRPKLVEWMQKKMEEWQ